MKLIIKRNKGILDYRNILEICVFMSIVLSPFDGINVQYFGLLQSGFFYPTIIGILIFFITIKNRKIYINRLIVLYILFLIYVFVLSILNLDNILGVEFKGRSAENNMISAYRSLIIILVIMFYYLDVFIRKEKLIFWIFKAFTYSFYIVMIYGFIQILAMLDIDIANEFVIATQQYINVQMANAGDFGKDVFDWKVFRVTGVSQEASTFGTYMIVLFPWLCMGIFYFKHKLTYKILCIIAIIFVILSYSRIAYACIFVEIICMLFVIKNIRNKILSLKSIIIMTISVIIGLLVVVMNNETLGNKIFEVIFSFSTQATDERINSNLTRLGLQYAAFSMFLSNPFIGVGLGQYQFNMVDFLPVWSYLSPEIQGLMEAGNPLYFYGTFNTHLRILAENGIFGFLLWIVIAWCGLKNYLKILKCINEEYKDLIKFIIISYIASFLGFMNFDMYLFFFYWLLLCLSIALVYKIRNLSKKMY